MTLRVTPSLFVPEPSQLDGELLLVLRMSLVVPRTVSTVPLIRLPL